MGTRVALVLLLLAACGGGGTSPTGHDEPVFSLAQGVNSAAPIPGDQLAVGDFNGDGKLDVVVTTETDAQIASALGKGDGTFMPNSQPGMVGLVHGIVAGDFNGDGKLDVAVAEMASVGAGVGYFGGGGDGTFTAAPAVAIGAGANALVAGDFNGDGKPDLVVADGTDGNLVTLLEGSKALVRTPLVQPAVMASGDFNGDGKLDLAVGNGKAPSPTLTILLGVGDGSFGAGMIYPLSGYSVAAIAAGDLDGDGKTDLVTNGKDQTMEVFLGKGDGSFALPASVALDQGGAAKIMIADLNGGGRPDLIVIELAGVGGAALGVLLGRGDGSFVAPLTVGTFTTSGDVVVADADGDGKLDLVSVIGATMTTLINTSH